MATPQRGTHQCRQRYLGQAPDQRLGLCVTVVVEGHFRITPGENTCGVRRGAAMSYQDHGAHAATLRTR